VCGNTLLPADHEPASPHEWEHWFTTARKAITRHNLAATTGTGTPDTIRIRLVHTTCRNQATNTRNAHASTHPKRPQGLA
jgi:RNA-directed DNA polymerase